MRSFKPFGKFFGLLLAVPLLTGCWDISSPEMLHIPTILAIDWKNGTYQVSIQTVSPTLIKLPGGGGSTKEAPIWVIHGQGRSLTSAIRNTGLNYPNKNPQSMAHLRVVVLGTSVLTSKAWPGVVDRLSRTPFLYRTFWVFATLHSALTIAQSGNPTGPEPMMILSHAVNNAQSSGILEPVRYFRLASRLYDTPYLADVIPLVAVKTPTAPDPGEEYVFPGAVVVRQGKVLGTLRARQIPILGLLTNKFSHPLIHVQKGGTAAVLQVIRHQSHWSWTPGQAHLTVKADLNVLEMDTSAVPAKVPSWVHPLATKSLTSQIRQLVEWSIRHRADIFGVGQQAELHDPRHFNTANWPQVWGQSHVKISVRTTLMNTGAMR